MPDTHRLASPLPHGDVQAVSPHPQGSWLMAILLAFDTSTERLHIGLAAGEVNRIAEGDGGARASSLLISQLHETLRSADLDWHDVDAIAFGQGPGAFTGLRAACAVAQGLAFGLGKPVLPIDTLMAVAECARASSGVRDVWVAMDARMDEIYAARYRHAGGSWRTEAQPALYTIDSLHAAWQLQPPACIAGTALAAFGDRLDSGPAFLLPHARPDGAALLSCAAWAWARGAICEPARAWPVYVRDRVALTTAEREGAKPPRAAG